VRWQRAKGGLIPLNQKLTPELFQAHWKDIVDWSLPSHPSNAQTANMNAMSNLATASLPPLQADASSSSSSSSSSNAPPSHSLGKLKCAPFFDEMASGIKENPDIAKQVSAVLKYRITSGEGNKTITSVLVDLKVPGGKISVIPPEDDTKSDLTITVSDDDFVGIATQKLNPQTLFFQKKLVLTGNIMLAQKLQVLFNANKQRAKL